MSPFRAPSADIVLLLAAFPASLAGCDARSSAICRDPLRDARRLRFAYRERCPLARAKLNLDTTSVRAPIDGVAGAVLVGEGALVRKDQRNLATIH